MLDGQAGHLFRRVPDNLAQPRIALEHATFKRRSQDSDRGVIECGAIPFFALLQLTFAKILIGDVPVRTDHLSRYAVSVPLYQAVAQDVVLGGCNAYIVKPIETAKLKKELKALGLID